MKRSYLVLIAVLTLLCLTACSTTHGPDRVFDAPAAKPRPSATEAAQPSALPLPEDGTYFLFSSGAGAWGTELTLLPDGSFTGSFHDSNMGETGEGYPHGTVYVCAFSGKFGDIEPVSDYAYRMRLEAVQTQVEPGQTWIEDDIRYVAGTPYGIDGGTEFILYLPQTPLSEMSEELSLWWPLRFDQQSGSKTTFSCYGILNVTTQQGFFSCE